MLETNQRQTQTRGEAARGLLDCWRAFGQWFSLD